MKEVHILVSGQLKAFKNRIQLQKAASDASTEEVRYHVHSITSAYNRFDAGLLLSISYFCEDHKKYSPSYSYVMGIIDKYNDYVMEQFKIRKITSKELVDVFSGTPLNIMTGCEVEF